MQDCQLTAIDLLTMQTASKITTNVVQILTYIEHRVTTEV